MTIPAQALGGNSAQRRHVRVSTPGVQARVAGTQGRLLNLSATGALVQIPRDLTTDRIWLLQVDVESETVDLPVRVIRSKVVSVQLPHATWRRQEFAVAVAFMEMDERRRELLAKLCGAAFSQLE